MDAQGRDAVRGLTEQKRPKFCAGQCEGLGSGQEVEAGPQQRWKQVLSAVLLLDGENLGVSVIVDQRSNGFVFLSWVSLVLRALAVAQVWPDVGSFLTAVRALHVLMPLLTGMMAIAV